MLLLSPPLAAILEAVRKAVSGEGAPEAVRTALGPARRFVQTGSRLLERLGPTLLHTETVRELLASAHQEVEAQERALDDLEQALAESRPVGLQRAADHLRSSSERFQDALRGLQGEELRSPPLSPDRALDLFLKILRNVLDGHVSPEVLAGQFRAAASRVSRLEAAARRFEALYDHPALVARAAPAMQRLEAGLGAAAGFLRSGGSVLLEDALNLLGPASAEIHETLAAMGAARAAGPTQARHPLVEDLFRARARSLSREAREELWNETTLALDEEATRVEGLQAHPLRLLAGLDVEEPARLLEQARKVLAGARIAGLDRADLAGLDRALVDLRASLALQAGRLATVVHPVQGAPLLEHLQVCVGRALLGQLPPAELLAVLEHLQGLQDGLVAELPDAGSGAGPEELTLRGLLDRQAEAREHLAAWCHDGDPHHLRGGWAMMADTAGPMLEINRTLRSRLETSTPAAAAYPCVRCGASNPRETRYCRSCGAVLPALAQAPTEYSDITGPGEASGATPAHVARLETLLHEVEAGQAGPAEVAAAVDDLLAKAERVAQGFQQSVVPRARQDASLGEYARFFEEQMELYLEGLHTFRCFAEDGHPDHLYRGLEACRSAGVELVALSATLQEAARS